ncbi:hypothetical protein [Arthrobacter zhaoguopingii]|uniref:hypothetical protein n=1 Tax=Arthrobacter zhaoguopingii TaxID=2681491 RepID=UPI001356FBEB|nr:hypothetical protein [Arthrobacter zhaoguopingii]
MGTGESEAGIRTEPGTRRSEAWTYIAVVALLCGSLMCLLSLGVYVHKPADSASFLCHESHGPDTAGLDLPSSEFNEGSVVRGEWTIWPMGIECTWQSTVNGRKVTYQSWGWAITWVMATGLVLTAGGVGAASRARGKRKVN